MDPQLILRSLVQSYSPGCAIVHPYLHASLDPPESTSQTTSRSVHRLLQGSQSWQTDRQTDHATQSVTLGRIYIRTTAMRPNNTIHVFSVLYVSNCASRLEFMQLFHIVMSARVCLDLWQYWL